jgi:hypothetical protein
VTKTTMGKRMKRLDFISTLSSLRTQL